MSVEDQPALVDDDTLHFISDAIPHVVWRARPDGTVNFVSRRWYDLTGTSPSAIMENDWVDALHPEDVPGTVRGWERALRTGLTFEAEHRFRHADGTYHWYLARATPTHDARGSIVAWHGTLTEVDLKKRSELALRLILKADAMMASSLEVRSVYQELLKIVVPEIADWAAVYAVEEDGRIVLADGTHADAAARERIVRLRGLTAADVSDRGALAAVVRRGEPALVRDLEWTDILRPSVADSVRALGGHTTLLVPIIFRRRMLAVLSAHACKAARQLDERDLPVMIQLANRAANAVNNAGNYESQYRVADVFQRATLPTGLPSVAGIKFSAMYQAGSSEALVGGDWYDALELPDGTFLISIGDVAGNGLAAAITMGSVRRAIRALAHVLDDPESILDSADRMLRGEEGPMVTAVVAIYDPRTRKLRFASAGHPPPLLAVDGQVRELTTRGLPLGLRHYRRGETREVDVEPGALLVLYTDGLIESTRDILQGERSLYAALADPGLEDRTDPSNAIYNAVLPHGPADDVAILTMRTSR